MQQIRYNPQKTWARGDFSFDEVVVKLDQKSIDDIARVVESYSTLQGEASDEAIKNAFQAGKVKTPILKEQIEEAKKKYIHQGPGLFITEGLSQGIEKAYWRHAFVVLSYQLGHFLPTDGIKIVKEVKDRGRTLGQPGVHYSETKQGGGFHTDGAEFPMPVPETFALMCVQQGIKGGAFQAMSAYSVHQRLCEKVESEIVAELFKPFHVDLRGHGKAGEVTTQKPIFFQYGKDKAEKHLGFTYLRKYIDVGHSYSHIPDLTNKQILALDALDTILEEPQSDLIAQTMMQPGQTGFFNNMMIIHARQEFMDGEIPEERRLLLRSWNRARGISDLRCPTLSELEL